MNFGFNSLEHFESMIPSSKTYTTSLPSKYASVQSSYWDNNSFITYSMQEASLSQEILTSFTGIWFERKSRDMGSKHTNELQMSELSPEHFQMFHLYKVRISTLCSLMKPFLQSSAFGTTFLQRPPEVTVTNNTPCYQQQSGSTTADCCYHVHSIQCITAMMISKEDLQQAAGPFQDEACSS